MLFVSSRFSFVSLVSTLYPFGHSPSFPKGAFAALFPTGSCSGCHLLLVVRRDSEYVQGADRPDHPIVEARSLLTSPAMR